MSLTRATTPALAHLSPDERALLARVKAAVLAIEPGAEAILYGSRARGDLADQLLQEAGAGA